MDYRLWGITFKAPISCDKISTPMAVIGAIVLFHLHIFGQWNLEAQNSYFISTNSVVSVCNECHCHTFEGISLLRLIVDTCKKNNPVFKGGGSVGYK